MQVVQNFRRAFATSEAVEILDQVDYKLVGDMTAAAADALFFKFDADGNGVLDADELAEMMTGMGHGSEEVRITPFSFPGPCSVSRWPRILSEAHGYMYSLSAHARTSAAASLACTCCPGDQVNALLKAADTNEDGTLSQPLRPGPPVCNLFTGLTAALHPQACCRRTSSSPS